MPMLSKLVTILCLLGYQAKASIFGEEVVPLFQLVAGQVKEIERLSQMVGVSKDQLEAAKLLNEGISKTVDQIQALETIVERARGLDPSAVKSIADLNDYLSRVQDAKKRADEIISIRLKASEIGIAQSALQGDTAYKTGQELITTGSILATASQRASPGRAAQISAASGSAQMIAKGVELQTLAQMVQLQALTLDFQRAQLERESASRRASDDLFFNIMKRKSKKSLP